MVVTVINAIIAAITSLVNAMASQMNITQNVTLFGFILWTVYISIILWFVWKLMKAVDNG